MATPPKNLFNDILLYFLVILLGPPTLWLIVYIVELIYNFILSSGISSSSNKNYSTSFVNESTVFWLIIILIAFSLFLIYKIPKRQVRYLESQEDSSPKMRIERKKDRIKLEDEIRKTLTQVIGGCFVAATIYFTYVSYDQSRKAKNSEQVSKALEALKENSISTAGVYLLEKAAVNSPEDVSAIIKVLCSHLQEKAGIKKEKSGVPEAETITSNTFAVTISTIIRLSPQTVDTIDLSRIDFRNRDLRLNKSFPKNVNLSDSNLSGVMLDNVDFSEAILDGAVFDETDFSKVQLGSVIKNLTGANLTKVRLYSYPELQGLGFFGKKICENDQYDRLFNCELKILKEADLTRVNLSENRTLGSSDLTRVILLNAVLVRTNLNNANLTDANLTEANLTEANLTGANLTDTNFSGAIMTNAKLFDVDISKSKGLSLTQIKDILIDNKTILPDPFKSLQKELLDKTQRYLEEQDRKQKATKIIN